MNVATFVSGYVAAERRLIVLDQSNGKRQRLVSESLA